MAFFNLFSFKNENPYRTDANKRPVLWWKKNQDSVKNVMSLLHVCRKSLKYFERNNTLIGYIFESFLFVSNLFKEGLLSMAIPVVEFSSEGYKIRNIFA